MCQHVKSVYYDDSLITDVAFSLIISPEHENTHHVIHDGTIPPNHVRKKSASLDNRIVIGKNCSLGG